MERTQVRVELLRIAYARHGDDHRALEIAKAWEVWVMEATEATEPKPKKLANPTR